MTITIREYTVNDFADCRNLWDELARYHAEIYEDPSIAGSNPARYLEQFLSRPDLCGAWVAEVNGRLVGFAGLLDVMGEEGVGEIDPLVISMEARGQGIGTRMIETIKGEAVRRQLRFLTIRPALRNRDAFLLYVRLGFDHVGSVELFQDLRPAEGRKWLKGITMHGQDLLY